MTLRVFINPQFPHADVGDGGIRRVVEAQTRYLPQFDVEVVASEALADVVACHAGSYVHTQKPFVAHNHGLYWDEYKWGDWAHELNAACINVLRRADVVTAPSNWVGYSLKRGMNLDAHTVYHGIDVDEWQPAGSPHPYVLWNKSRVDAVCDPAPVVALAKRLPTVDFVSTYGESASNLRITGRVPFEQAKNLVRGATIYLATARETFGIGTLEAMAAGVVVVGYDWAGQSEIITNGVDGLLVPPGDIEALAYAVERASQDADKYRTAAHETASQFTWERACQIYADLYKQAFAMQQPKRTSVIITCYNLAASLPRAVASVDDPDAEIVIVDDASPDDTPAVADGLAASDPRIKVVHNAENLYLSGSLDAGIQAASGAYILPLDADNELAPGATRALADALDRDPDTDVAYGAMKVIEDKPGGHVFVSGWPSNFVYEQQITHHNQIPSTSMYRRKWWERAGGYRRRCRTAEDADFWCRITSLGAQPKKVTEWVTLVYHDRADSMSHAERDWPWENWYTWAGVPTLTPFGAVTAKRRVPTYEPAAVTVVIPVGPGHGKYLHDALDSLVAQTHQNWRCIVVDDTGTTEVHDSHLPPWVELWAAPSIHPVTPAVARNIGLQAAGTPYVVFLDADDYLAPNALEVMLGAARERGWTAANEWYYSDWFKQEEAKVYKAPDFNAESLRSHLTHSVTAMYPVHLLQKLGGFDAALDAWEDWDLVLKLIEAGACGVHLPFPLFYYRYYTGQRREQLYKDRHRHTEVMRTKWRKYMVENAPMACGCQGGKTVYVAPVTIGADPIPVSKDGRTLVEFIGHSAPRTWRGPSGSEYRFGSDDGHKLHQVANEDLQTFMNRHDFRIPIADQRGFAILEAQGPPNRDKEFDMPPPAPPAVPAITV